MRLWNLFWYNPYFNAIRGIRGVLDYDQKKRGAIMILLLLVNAMMDLFGLATIGVLIQSALQGEAITAVEYSRSDAGSEAAYIFNSSLRWIYHSMDFTSEMQLLFFLSIFIFIVFLIKNALSLGILYLQSRYSFNIALRLSRKMFQHFYNQGFLFISNNNTGKKIYSIFEIPMRFAGGYLFPFFNFSTDLFVLILISIGLILVNPMAILLLFVAVVPTFFGVYTFSKRRIQQLGETKNELYPKAYASINEAMRAFVNVKLGNKESFVLERYTTIQRTLNGLEAKLIGFYNKINQKTNDIVFGLGILVIFGFAYFSDQSKGEVLVLLGFFGVATYKMLPAINNMVGNLLGMKSFSYVIKELKPLVNLGIKEYPIVKPLSFTEAICLKDIGFYYPDTSGKHVIKNFNLEIKKGETIGIVGSSGSGKTTLLKIILRLLRENRGSFWVDDKRLETEEDDAAFQNIIGYVEQETFIVEGSLRENIAILETGREINESRLLEAIKDAQLQDFVKEHPKGLDMQLGEAGIKLSGGQKQRVGIARALYKNPEILVLDEITSALDAATEQEIVKVINHLSGTGKTIIIVAHRKSTLEKADRVMELK